MPAARKRVLKLATALVMSVTLQSCFTVVLWDSDLRDKEKLYLTPVSVALDVVTFPAQVAVFGCEGACSGHTTPRHRRGGCR